MREILTTFNVIDEANDVKTISIAKLSAVANFDQHYSGAVESDGHSGLEYHVESRLPGGFEIVGTIRVQAEGRMHIPYVIGS